MTKKVENRKQPLSGQSAKLAERLAGYGLSNAAIRHLLNKDNKSYISSAVNWIGQVKRRSGKTWKENAATFLYGCRHTDRTFGEKARIMTLVSMNVPAGVPRQSEMPESFGPWTGYILRNGLVHAMEKGKGRKTIAKALEDLSLPAYPAKQSPKRMFGIVAEILEK